MEVQQLSPLRMRVSLHLSQKDWGKRTVVANGCLCLDLEGIYNNHPAFQTKKRFLPCTRLRKGDNRESYGRLWWSVLRCCFEIAEGPWPTSKPKSHVKSFRATLLPLLGLCEDN